MDKVRFTMIIIYLSNHSTAIKQISKKAFILTFSDFYWDWQSFNEMASGKHLCQHNFNCIPLQNLIQKFGLQGKGKTSW